MPCSICYERFAAPVALPCGHVFCRECLRRTVRALNSSQVQHNCPTCRRPYNVVTVDPALVPEYLRPHIAPAIRPLFLEDTMPPRTEPAEPAVLTPTSEANSASPPPLSPVSSGSSPAHSHSQPGSQGLTLDTPPPPSTALSLGQAIAETNALRDCCTTWRRRAEIHAAANTALLNFGRTAKAQALRMRAERDQARSQCELMKRKIDELLAVASASDSDQERDGARDGRETKALAARAARCAPRGFPVYLAQRRHQQQLTPPSEQEQDDDVPILGPSMKRRKIAKA